MVILMTLQALLLLALQLWIVTYSLFISSTRASSESCMCLPEYECMDPHGPYGSHPLDVAVLGLHAPCPVYGQVRCCDKSVVKWYYQDDRTEYVHGNADVGEYIVEDLHLDVISDDSESDEKKDLCGCLDLAVCPPSFRQYWSEECKHPLVLCCVRGYPDRFHEKTDIRPSKSKLRSILSSSKQKEDLKPQLRLNSYFPVKHNHFETVPEKARIVRGILVFLTINLFYVVIFCFQKEQKRVQFQ